jgi:hypothetical protein
VKNEASIEASGNESQQANEPQKPDFPEEWNKLLEKEIFYLDNERQLGQKLLKKENEQQKKVLLQWKPLMKKEELEQGYGQSEIEEAQLWFKARQEELEKEIVNIEEAMGGKEVEIKAQKEMVKQKEDELKGLIEEKNAIPKKIEVSDKKIKDLKDRIDQADGPVKQLMEKELATEKDRLSDLKSDDYTGLIESAIITICTAWLDAMKELASRSESKETQSIEIEIKKKEMEYLSNHQYYLMKEYLG